MFIQYIIPIQWSNGQALPWHVRVAAGGLDRCPEMVATVPREMLAGAFNLPLAGWLQIKAVHFIPDGTGVVPP
jgi:hypothetical protein